MAPPSAPDRIETPRLELRRPLEGDADAIFSRFSSDPDVTRLVGWPMHRSLDDARRFLAYSDAQWRQWPAGPYLILSRSDGSVLGSTGLAFETPFRAQTGYVLAKDVWGRGLATEALDAMVGLARATGVRRLYALCHHSHSGSARVLEKCDFAREGVLRAYAEFPNLAPVEPQDVLCYAILL
jgi:ribosomal-protein-alanine N-acetyltransferase